MLRISPCSFAREHQSPLFSSKVKRQTENAVNKVFRNSDSNRWLNPSQEISRSQISELSFFLEYQEPHEIALCRSSFGHRLQPLDPTDRFRSSTAHHSTR